MTNTLHIDITLGGALIRYRPANTVGNQIRLVVNPKASIADVLGQLGVEPDTRVMIVCNGAVIAADQFAATTLSDNDQLSLITPLQAG